MTRKLCITLAAVALFLALTTAGSARPLDQRQKRDISSDSLDDRDLLERSFIADDALEPRGGAFSKVIGTVSSALKLSKKAKSKSKSTPAPKAAPKPKRTSAQRRADHKAAGKPNKKNATQRKAAGLPALPKSRKARAQARKAKGVPKVKKGPGAGSALRGKAAATHAATRKAEKNKAKNDSRNANLRKKNPTHTDIGYAGSKKAGKIADRKRLQGAQRADDATVNGIKTAGRPAIKNKAAAAAAAAAEKATHRTHLANAKAAHKDSLATGTFPARDAKFTTAKGNTYTGKDVRQAAFTAHLSAQNPVGYKSSDGKNLPAKQRHPKEFENREQGPATARAKPLPVITDGTKYREYGIVHDKQKGYDGRSPNPTEARVITKPNAAGVHEFKAVVAHPNIPVGSPGANDHVAVPQTP